MANEVSTPVYQFDTQKSPGGLRAKGSQVAVSPPIYAAAAYDFRDVENAADLIVDLKQAFQKGLAGN